MARRTVYLPEVIDQLVHDSVAHGESYSSALCRLVEAGFRAGRGTHTGQAPAYVGSGEGPEDLGRMAERYLENLTSTAGPNEEQAPPPPES